MFICPSCSKNGIGCWSKFWSGSDSPSKCRYCNELYYVHSKYRFGLQSGWPTLIKILGAILCIYLAFEINSLMYIALLPFIWIICSFWELALLPLMPISEAQAVERKKNGNWFLFGIAVVIGIIYVVKNL